MEKYRRHLELNIIICEVHQLASADSIPSTCAIHTLPLTPFERPQGNFSTTLSKLQYQFNCTSAALLQNLKLQ